MHYFRNKVITIEIIILLLVNISTSVAGQKISDFRLEDLNNQMQAYSKLKGEKLTIIDFWATWCKPCIQAIPKLNKIYTTYKDRGIEIIGINADGPRNTAKIKPFTKRYKMEYPVLLDPNSKIARMLNVAAYPTLYILNSENEIVYTHTGFRIGDEKIVEEEIIKLLNEK